MSNFSSHIKELRELIAGSSSAAGPASAHFEAKLREVLPSLLRDHVLPSPTANERETTAVLKLLTYTARRFPGVFFNGRPAQVVRAIGRILPFFADPDYQSIIFDTVWSLLSLLRTGDREAYRQFFLDLMTAVEDLEYVASNHAESGCAVKCLSGSFSDILDSPAIFSELPDRFQPRNGPGVLVDLSGGTRWCPFATSLMRLINKCLTDGTLHVEGLLTMPFVSAAGSIICYGDESLHKVCFDFARIVATVTTVEILPMETIIRSITLILSKNVNELSIVRDADYDFSMGACLHALHSSCPGYIVESTAADIVNAFARAVQTSRSPELQAAMCNAYKRIVEFCPPQVWNPEILLKLLYLPNPYGKLTECIRLVVDKFGQSSISVDDRGDQGSFQEKSEIFDLTKVGQKRIAQNQENIFCYKRRKVSESQCSADSSTTKLFSAGIRHKLAKDYAYDLQLSLNSCIKFLSPDNHNAYPLEPEIAIKVLSLLCLSLCVNPKTSLFIRISKQVLSWIPWICKQATKKCLFSFDVLLYFEALQTVMLLQSSHRGDTKLFEDEARLIGDRGEDFGYPAYDDLISLLKRVWSDGHASTEACLDWKLKCLMVQVIAKIGDRLNTECYLEVLELAIHSEAAEEYTGFIKMQEGLLGKLFGVPYVWCIKFIARMGWFVVGAADVISVYNYKNTIQKVTSFKASSIPSLAIHPTQPYALSTGRKGVELWAWGRFGSKWKCMQVFKDQSDLVLKLAFNPEDHDSFAGGCRDGTIKVWSLDSPISKYTLTGHSDSVGCLEFFTRDGQQYLITGSADKTAKIWDMQMKECVHTLHHRSQVHSVLPHPTLSVLVTGAENGLVYLWSSINFRLKRILNIHGRWGVYGLACLNESGRVVVAHADGLSIIEISDEEEQGGSNYETSVSATD